jgi:hypothetical protein
MRDDPTVACPHCGGEIKKSAKACPHCGSDEETGWSESTYLDGIDLPDDADYDELRDNEFNTKPRSKSKQWWIIISGAVILTIFLLGALAALR